MLIIIVSLLLNFSFYCFGLQCILDVLFLCTLVTSLWAFLSFRALVFIGFLLLTKDAIFTFSRFPQIDYCLPWNSTFGTCFLLNAFGYRCKKVPIFFIWIISFRCLRKNTKLVSYSYRKGFLISLLVSEDQSYREALTVCIVFFSA